jgi:lipopolysaccharide export system protein LptA
VRLTIERMRTLVLVAGLLLVLALVAFLAIGKWKQKFIGHDLPKRLGIDIQQEANGFTHVEFHAGKATVKITASRVEQLKDNHFRLHAATIEMYGADGRGLDRIEGNEFEYDQQAGIAQASGPVEITLSRLGEASGVLPGKAHTHAPGDAPKTETKSKSKTGPLASAVAGTNTGEIHIETSGLTFNQKSGIASTAERVQFTLAQGSGSAVGATYNSQSGLLVLDHAVEMQTERGAEPVNLIAAHAEYDRDQQVCHLRVATLDYRGGTAHAAEAQVAFRDDGSAERLDATEGFTFTNKSGGHVAAPTAVLLLDARNQPSHGHLEGGVIIDSNRNGRTTHGTAPTAELEFGAKGVLRRAHLERGVLFASDAQSGAMHTHRLWSSPVADLDFRDAANGRLQLASIHGTGGVIVNSDSRRGTEPETPARLAGDDVTGIFGADSSLTAMTGIGHARMEQTTPDGTRQTTAGDRIEVHLSPAADAHGRTTASDVESATVTGNVVLLQQPAPKPGAPAPAQLRATAERAVYEGAGQWLHLTGTPRIEDGGLQLTAVKIDVSQATGDAFAHGNVKSTWFGESSAAGAKPQTAPAQPLGGQGPAHIVAAEAQLHKATGEAAFQGQARLWQGANSIVAPAIVLDHDRRTLTAHATSPDEPVRVVMLSAAGQVSGQASGPASTKARSGNPSVVRVSGGDLKYSDAERRAVMLAGAAGAVVAETADATTRSSEVELLLLPAGNHAGPNGGASQVDRITALGHVTIESQGRRGSGEQLVFQGETGDYTLTGTAAAPPRMTDPARGVVTGEALIFNSRDDSVNVEGGGRATSTETTVPKRPH